MTLTLFTEMWTSSGYPPQPVIEADLRSLERCLGIRLPEDYRQAILEVGLPRPNISLLDTIVERQLDMHSLSELFSPTEIVEETLGWRELGMPVSLIAFASDGSGNKFCFDAVALKNGSPEGSAVWFYDHDFGTIDRVAQSFASWIDAYCRVEPWREPDAM